MTDQVLDILKLVLLALLYLFFARVLWAVWSEVRQPADARRALDPTPSAGIATPPTPVADGDVTTGRRRVEPGRGRGEVPARLVVLEPKDRRGTAFPIAGAVIIGRETDSSIVIADDEYVSSRHATVSIDDDGRVVVVDHASRNGTFVNGTKISQRHTVRRGDRLQIGYTVLEAQ